MTAKSTDNNGYFNYKQKGNLFLPEYYEGFLTPRSGVTPFKIVDDPNIIAKKNQMRQALRDEFTKRLYNPYRWASGVSGHVFDPAVQRYFTLTRVGWQYYRPGPKMSFLGFMTFCVVPGALWFVIETGLRKSELEKRSGLIAYKDRKNKFVT